MDSILNVGFFVFHTSWIAFTCLGWIWRRARPWHLAAASLTALSWFGLGVLYGWGYCPCTDWHWQIRARLGHPDPPSYIELVISEITGDRAESRLGRCTGGVHACRGPILSILLNLRNGRAHAGARASSTAP